MEGQLDSVEGFGLWGGKSQLTFKFIEKKPLPKTNIAPENRPKPKRKVVFQPSIVRGEHVSSRECRPLKQPQKRKGNCLLPPLA